MSEISDFRQLAFELIDSILTFFFFFFFCLFITRVRPNSILTVVKCYLHEVLACFR